MLCLMRLTTFSTTTNNCDDRLGAVKFVRVRSCHTTKLCLGVTLASGEQPGPMENRHFKNDCRWQLEHARFEVW